MCKHTLSYIREQTVYECDKCGMLFEKFNWR